MSNLEARDVRSNFLCLAWVGSVFAMGWSEVAAVLQPLLVFYGASNFEIGLVQGVLIATLPGMFLSPWVTRRFRYKRIYLFTANTFYLLPLGLVGILVWHGGIVGRENMVAAIVWLMLAGQIAAGFGGLPNQEFFTACIPMRLRGRLAGVSAGLGGLLGLAAGAFAVWILEILPKPQGYGVLLVLAWFLCQAADSGVLFAKEPPTPVELSPRPWSAAMWKAFLADSRFLRITLVVCLLSPLLTQLAIFSSAFAFRDLEFQPAMAGWLAVTASTARLALSPLAGWFTDRTGARFALLLWSGLGAVGFLFLAAIPVSGTVFVAAALAAVAGSGFSGAMNALTCGIPAPEHRAGHFTLLGFCMIATNSLIPLLCGHLLDLVSYRTGFAILGAVATLALTLGIYLLRSLSNQAEDYS